MAAKAIGEVANPLLQMLAWLVEGDVRHRPGLG